MLQLGNVTDQGLHTNCAGHSQTFPAPINLQPSFWASVNNRESLSLNPYILFANITERYSGNANICQLCSLIFHKIYQGRNNNNNNMSSSSMHCVTKKRQSLIDKGFAKSRRQIYELIGLLYRICRIASL